MQLFQKMVIHNFVPTRKPKNVIVKWIKISGLFFTFYILISCERKKPEFKLPVGIAVNEKQGIKFIDSIINSYDSIDNSHNEFKLIGDYILRAKNNINYKKKIILYDQAQPVYPSIYFTDSQDRLITASFILQKSYNPTLYKVYSTYASQNPDLIIDNKIIDEYYRKEIKADKFKKDGKERLQVTFQNLVASFNKKYGPYNYTFNGWDRSSFREKAKAYIWFKDGIMIEISHIRTDNDDIRFDPPWDNKYGIDIKTYTTDHGMKWEDEFIHIAYHDINGEKTQSIKQKQIEIKTNDYIRVKKENRTLMKKAKQDSINKSNTDKIYNKI